MNVQIGKVLIIIGILILITGILIFFVGDKFSFPGKLPGDIRIEKENFSFYFPITTLLIISVFLTLLVNLIRKFF